MTMADRLALMRAGEVVQAGAPRQLYEEPVDRFAAEFLGPVNFFAGSVARVVAGIATVELAGAPVLLEAAAAASPPAPGAAVTVAVRPERMVLRPGHGPGDGGLPGAVEDVAYLGTHTTCRVRVPGVGLVKVLVRQPAESGIRLAPGEPVTVAWAPRDARLLPP